MPADGHPGQVTVNTSTIPFKILRSYVEVHNSTMPLVPKKSAMAALMRSKDVPKIQSTPHAVLPGSFASLEVIINSKSDFKLVRRRDLEDERTPLSEASLTKPGLHKQKITITLGIDETNDFLNLLNIVNVFLVELNKRAELREEISGEEGDFLVVPLALLHSINAIEDMFEGGSSDEVKIGLIQLKKAESDLKNFFSMRRSQFTNQVNLVREINSRVLKRGDSGEFDDRDIHLPALPSSLDASAKSGLFPTYLGHDLPSDANQKLVNDVLKNLIFDFYLVGSNWQANAGSSQIGMLLEPLSMRFSNEIEKEFEKGYEEVQNKCQLAISAIGERRKRDDSEEMRDSKLEIDEILTKTDWKTSPEHVLEFSPDALKSEVQEIIDRLKLTDVMLREIKSEFPKLAESWSDGGEEKDLAKKIKILSSIKGNIARAEEILFEANEVLAETSQLHDKQTVREDGRSDLKQHRINLSNLKKEASALDKFAADAEALLVEVTDWFESLRESLGGGAQPEALFWIGLGQAGGQILRECLSYAVANMSDARCSALLSALGLDQKDKAELRRHLKSSFTENPTDRKIAEKKMRTIFDKKAHLLAINLGEEIDKLASEEASGYYFWGEQIREKKNTDTVRDRRNILKLIKSGKGAGGATGVGRAYGFRYEADIADALRDVGTKNARSPAHIVITHSLSGGSGSGMVLPVLERVRKTFGSDTVVWVVSVGEGRHEENSKAMVNSPFIVSDILQAHYDGIHAIAEPLELNDFSHFKFMINNVHEQLRDKTEALLDSISSEGDEDDSTSYLDRFSRLFQTHATKINQVRNEQQRKLKESRTMLRESNHLQDSGINQDKLEKACSSLDGKDPWTPDFSEVLTDILPDDTDAAKQFSSWCAKKLRGGVRPAVDFWKSWRDAFSDPLSMLFRGRDQDSLTASDQENEGGTDHFEPLLSGLHLRLVGWDLIREIDPEDKRVAMKPKSPDAISPLFENLRRIVSDSEEKAKEIQKKLMDYASKLDQFHDTLRGMNRRILSLSGAGMDKSIKSVLVSNAHIELGVKHSGRVAAQGEVYTVYNSVIFDLMLNVIAPRLPKEPGVWHITDNEVFDHSDMINHTTPPLVIGMLKHRDSTSMSEEHHSYMTDFPHFDEEFNRMFNAIVANEYVDADNTHPNLAFIESIPPSGLLIDFMKAMFGPRFRYLWGINPLRTMELSGADTKEVEEFVATVEHLWDTNPDLVFGISHAKRKSLDVTSMHIGNLFRWLSLVDLHFFSRAISETRESYEQKMNSANARQTTHLMESIKSKKERSFEQGVLTIDVLTQQYRRVSKPPNLQLLDKALPLMGIHNAELLRAVSPSYITTFYPVVISHIFDQDESQITASGAGEIDLSCEVYKAFSRKLGPDEAKERYVEKAKGAVNHLLQIFATANPQRGKKARNIFRPGFEKFSDFALEKVDLQISESTEDMRAKVECEVHPRLIRYLSVVRDIPVQPEDVFTSARSTAASASRFLLADRPYEPLDNITNNKKQSGVAGPSFNMGLDILNELRVSALLPDEMSLDFVTLTRILLMSNQPAEFVSGNIRQQAEHAGLNWSMLEPHLEVILGTPYPPMDDYKQPGLFPAEVSVMLKRLHKLKPLISELDENLPKQWTGFDRSNMKFLLACIDDYDFAFTPNDIDESLGQDVESVPRLNEWIQHVFDTVVHSGNLAEGHEESTPTKELNDAGPTPNNLGIRQLIYDIGSMTKEALRQAEYLGQTGDAKNVHFEMNGFSDRLLGVPTSMTLLIHDRNASLDIAPVKTGVRAATRAFSGGVKLETKEFTTAAPFGPDSLITTIFTKAPAADVGDQFYNLIHLKDKGLAGDEPDWALTASKLHPYIFLYNLLWLSTEVVGQWSQRSNHLYARRFEIPTDVIEHHYHDPDQMDRLASELESDKTAFKGDVKMPETDYSSFRSAADAKGDQWSGGYRNIVKLIGIMFVRHYHHLDQEEDKEEAMKILGKDYFDDVLEIFPDNKVKVPKKSLWMKEESADDDDDDFWNDLDIDLEFDAAETLYREFNDTLKDRTMAWAKALKNWRDYSLSSDDGQAGRNIVRESDKFNATASQPDLISSEPNAPAETVDFSDV